MLYVSQSPIRNLYLHYKIPIVEANKKEKLKMLDVTK